MCLLEEKRLNKAKADAMTDTVNDENSTNLTVKRWLHDNPIRWTMVDVALAVLAMYTGQYLMTRLVQSREWGLAVLAAGLGLAILRLKAPSASKLADCLQIGAGLFICLTLALDVDNWKAWTAPLELILVWLLSICLVTAPVLKLDPTPIILGWPQVKPLDRRGWTTLAALVLGAFLLRAPAIETIPRPVDPDEASLALSTLDVAMGKFGDPFAVGWASHPSLQWFIMAPSFHIFGRTFLAMRLPSAIMGAFAVGALYLAARTGW